MIGFIGTRLGHGPDAKTIHKYRAALAESGLMDELIVVMTDQLAAQGYELKEGAMTDGIMVQAPKQKFTKAEQEQWESGEIPNEWSAAKQRQKDLDASWTKKGKKSSFGYKRHVMVSTENELIFDSTVTTAKVHDIKVAKGVLEKVLKGCDVYGDRGYNSAPLRAHLEAKGQTPKIASRARQNETEEEELHRTKAERLAD